MFGLLFREAKVTATTMRGRHARGVVPVTLRVWARAKSPCRTLAIRPAEGGPALFQKRLPSAFAKARVDLRLHTHLLANGRERFTATLEDDGGAAAARATIDLEVNNAGPIAEDVRESLRLRSTPLIVEGPLDSALYDIGNPALAAWFDRDDAAGRIESLHAAGGLGDEEASILSAFVRDGYAVLPMRIDEPLIARVNRELDHAIASGRHEYRPGSGDRIRNLHLRYRGFRALWRDPQVLRWLNLIFAAPARPAQTLTYVYGSEQDAHQDTIHLTPFPAGYMCGVWVALEDVRPDSGELEIYPGSHRLPRVYMQGSGCAKVTDGDWNEFGAKIVARWRRMLEEASLRKIPYRPRRGEVLVWHENLMHGGGRRIDPALTRRSVVSHYFAEGALAFYDSTGEPGSMA